MKIPMFKESEAIVSAYGRSARALKPTELHRFVAAYEPASPSDDPWRRALERVVVEASRRANVIVPLDPPIGAIREVAQCRRQDRCLLTGSKPFNDDGTIACQTCVDDYISDYQALVSLSHGMTK